MPGAPRKMKSKAHVGVALLIFFFCYLHQIRGRRFQASVVQVPSVPSLSTDLDEALWQQATTSAALAFENPQAFNLPSQELRWPVQPHVQSGGSFQPPPSPSVAPIQTSYAQLAHVGGSMTSTWLHQPTVSVQQPGQPSEEEEESIRYDPPDVGSSEEASLRVTHPQVEHTIGPLASQSNLASQGDWEEWNRPGVRAASLGWAPLDTVLPPRPHSNACQANIPVCPRGEPLDMATPGRTLPALPLEVALIVADNAAIFPGEVLVEFLDRADSSSYVYTQRADTTNHTKLRIRLHLAALRTFGPQNEARLKQAFYEKFFQLNTFVVPEGELHDGRTTAHAWLEEIKHLSRSSIQSLKFTLQGPRAEITAVSDLLRAISPLRRLHITLDVFLKDLLSDETTDPSRVPGVQELRGIAATERLDIRGYLNLGLPLGPQVQRLLHDSLTHGQAAVYAPEESLPGRAVPRFPRARTPSTLSSTFNKDTLMTLLRAHGRDPESASTKWSYCVLLSALETRAFGLPRGYLEVYYADRDLGQGAAGQDLEASHKRKDPVSGTFDCGTKKLKLG